MSRKKNKQPAPPADTGGLNLTLPPQEENAIDVTAAPSSAHKAVEELETLPPAQSLSNFFKDEEPVQSSPAAFENGLVLNEALHMSSLWLAVRKTNNSSALIVCNGTRFWTVDANKLEPALYEGIGEVQGFSQAHVWRPVAGNERGWHVG